MLWLSPTAVLFDIRQDSPPLLIIICDPRRSETSFPPSSKGTPFPCLPRARSSRPCFKPLSSPPTCAGPILLRGNNRRRERERGGRRSAVAGVSRLLNGYLRLCAPLGPILRRLSLVYLDVIFLTWQKRSVLSICGWREATFAFRSGVRASNEPGSDRLKAGAFPSPL